MTEFYWKVFSVSFVYLNFRFIELKSNKTSEQIRKVLSDFSSLEQNDIFAFNLQKVIFRSKYLFQSIYSIHHLRLFCIGSLIESNGNQYFLLYYKSILFFESLLPSKKASFFRVHLNKLFGPCSCHFDCIELYTTTPSGDISGHFKTFSCATLKLNMSRRGNL